LEVSCSIPARSKGLCPGQPDTECKCVVCMYIRTYVHTYACMCVRMYVHTVYACMQGMVLFDPLEVCSLFSYMRACTLEWRALCVCISFVLFAIVHTCMHVRTYVRSFHPLFNPLPCPSPCPSPSPGMLLCPGTSKPHTGHWSRVLPHH